MSIAGWLISAILWAMFIFLAVVAGHVRNSRTQRHRLRQQELHEAEILLRGRSQVG